MPAAYPAPGRDRAPEWSLRQTHQPGHHLPATVARCAQRCLSGESRTRPPTGLYGAQRNAGHAQRACLQSEQSARLPARKNPVEHRKRRRQGNPYPRPDPAHLQKSHQQQQATLCTQRPRRNHLRRHRPHPDQPCARRRPGSAFAWPAARGTRHGSVLRHIQPSDHQRRTARQRQAGRLLRPQRDH